MQEETTTTNILPQQNGDIKIQEKGRQREVSEKEQKIIDQKDQNADVELQEPEKINEPFIQNQQKICEKNEEQLNESKKEMKQPALQMNMDSIFRIHPHIETKLQLLNLIAEAIEQVGKTISLLKSHQTINKYFQKANTNKEEIAKSYETILEGLVTIKKQTEDDKVNRTYVAEIIYFIAKTFKKISFDSMKTIDKAIWILQFECKVHSSLDFILDSLNLPDDIVTLPRSSKGEFWDSIKFQIIGDEKKIQQKYKNLKKLLSITTSAVLNEESSDWAISKLVSFGMSYPIYMVNSKQSQLIAMKFYRNPTEKLIQKIWNLPENGMTKQMVKLSMKNIVTNMKIYIPLDEQKLPKDILSDDGNSIQVRVLHNENLYKKQNQSKPGAFSCICSSQMDENDFNEINTVILHMHGGGFVAMSSRSMQVYTRRWARSLKIPVFSVDYRMPPNHPFPTAPEDCLKVYKFLLNHINKYFNISPKKIILAGDSAGGNLTCALTGLILKNNLSLPHGIYAAYPALDIRKQFSPSKIHAFTDPMLYPSVLLLCIKQYTKDSKQNQNHPLCSPILLTEQFIGGQKGNTQFPANWPKTVLHVGAKDPLYDDSIRLANKLWDRGVKCDLHVYENLSHGFLNLDFVVEECKKTIDDSIRHLQGLIK